MSTSSHIPLGSSALTVPQDNWVLELWTPCLVKALSLLVQCRDLPHGEERWKSPWEDPPPFAI